jgi:stage III sporulation protein AC
MLDVSLLFKMAAISLIVIILDKILKTSGKEELAVVTNIAGTVIILLMVIDLINKLFISVKTMFQL